MDKFKEGTECFHKATNKSCVVIRINEEEGTVKVRTEDDEEKDYFPQELKTKEEGDAEFLGVTGGPEPDPDPYY